LQCEYVGKPKARKRLSPKTGKKGRVGTGKNPHKHELGGQRAKKKKETKN